MQVLAESSFSPLSVSQVASHDPPGETVYPPPSLQDLQVLPLGRYPVLHWAIHKEGYDRFGFCFWDIKERAGVLNYISEVLDFDKLPSLLDKYDNKDAPFHHWHNYQRWHCSDPYIIHSVTDKPTAFANSYICKPSVFEPFKEDFLKWEKGVRGYDVHLHCKNQIQSWPWLPAACVIHLGCFDVLINDTWSCHKPVSKDDKRENLEK